VTYLEVAITENVASSATREREHSIAPHDRKHSAGEGPGGGWQHDSPTTRSRMRITAWLIRIVRLGTERLPAKGCGSAR
jgi:hypothetical protein